MRKSRVGAFRPREFGGALTVTGLSAGFGVVMMTASAALVRAMSGSGLDGAGAVRLTLAVLAWIFLGLALFVGGIVTVNTFATIVAGRAKQLALLRLLGASARSLRRTSASEGLVVGVVGALTGAAVGVVASQGVLAAGRRWWGLAPYVSAPWLSTDLIAPTLASVCVTVLAAWIGSRAILAITPIQAFGSAEAATETSDAATVKYPKRTAIVLALNGLVMLAVGAVVGLASPFGVLIAFPGGAGTFVAFMMASPAIMPRLLALFGSGATAPSRLAARNTARSPRRSSRATVGIVIGVGLVTMFAVAGATYADTTRAYVAANGTLSPADSDALSQSFALPVAIVVALVGFSAVLAGIGLMTSVSLTATQRQREVALLRALGLTRAQVRRMSFAESARMSLIASVIGLGLGVFYGWVGSLSTLGATMVRYGHLAPSVPWQLVLGVVVAAFGLTTVATVASTRRTVSVSPVAALAEG